MKAILACLSALTLNSALPGSTQAGTALSLVDLRHGYGLDAITIDGTAQKIAILIPMALDTEMIKRDLTQSVINIRQQATDLGFRSIAPAEIEFSATDSGLEQSGVTNVEAEIDTQLLHAVAPGAKIFLIAYRRNDASIVRALRMAVASGASVVSMSYGRPELTALPSTRATVNDIFARHPEITFVAASGDSGLNIQAGQAQVAYPASSPFVIAVGAINEDFSAHPGAWINSGGGESVVFDRPAWQLGLKLPGSGRMVPDVSMAGGAANPVLIVLNGLVTRQIGTSVAAPIFAGVVVLANQQNGEPLGDIHASLYTPADNKRNARDYRSATNAVIPGTVPAVNVYSFDAGLGVPRVQTMIDHLARDPGKCEITDVAGALTIAQPVASSPMFAGLPCKFWRTVFVGGNSDSVEATVI